MRILALSKRQYLGKDLLDDRFFRNYEIPEALAARGNEVRGIALSYRRRPEGISRPGNVEWLSFNALPGLPRYLTALTRTLDEFQPDIVWASSDALHAVIACHLCLGNKTPFVIDLYDNYDSFGLTQLPWMGKLFRQACLAANGLTVIGNALADYVRAGYGVSRPILVLGNAVRRDLFVRRDRRQARERLGLPQEGRIVGTAGALTRSRGVAVLFEAFLALAEEQPDLKLVVAGPRDHTPRRYRHNRIIDLGCLPFEHVPFVLAALDVGVICNVDSSFGRYCFPQKLYEIAACGTPLLAADVGESALLLAETPALLFRHGSTTSLIDALRRQLVEPAVPHLPIYDWHDRAAQLEAFLKETINAAHKHPA